MTKKRPQPLRKNLCRQRGKAPPRTLLLFLVILSFQVVFHVIDSPALYVQVELSLRIPEAQLQVAGVLRRQGGVDEEPDEIWERPEPQELSSADL